MDEFTLSIGNERDSKTHECKNRGYLEQTPRSVVSDLDFAALDASSGTYWLQPSVLLLFYNCENSLLCIKMSADHFQPQSITFRWLTVQT